MRAKFVHNLSNVQKFISGTVRVEKRGAAEACWQLVEGNPGFGKTKTLEWWNAQNSAAYVRAKSGWTLNWALKDIVMELGEKPENRNEALFNQALQRVALSRKTIIVDEINHAIHDWRILEMLRDLSDFTLTPIIVGGHHGVSKSLARYEQIYSRIADVTFFQACTAEDVATACVELMEGTAAADDMIEQIHQRTGGCFREVIKAIAEVERFGRKANKKAVAAADMQLSLLTSDGRARAATPRRVA